MAINSAGEFTLGPVSQVHTENSRANVCKLCFKVYNKNGFDFYDLCEDCFEKFDKAKMKGRLNKGPECETIEQFQKLHEPKKDPVEIEIEKYFKETQQQALSHSVFTREFILWLINKKSQRKKALKYLNKHCPVNKTFSLRNHEVIELRNILESF